MTILFSVLTLQQTMGGKYEKAWLLFSCKENEVAFQNNKINDLQLHSHQVFFVSLWVAAIIMRS